MYERHGSHDPARLETFLEWSTIRALGEPANASPEPAAWWSGGGVGKVGEVGRSYGSHDDFPGAEAVAGPRTTAYASTRTLAPSRPYAVSSRTERPFVSVNRIRTLSSRTTAPLRSPSRNCTPSPM
ncbi:hypothetical protein COCC4DRAFT_135974 [Bipolaris maydis ATCC 48331]|uniref:Uncharacterized protein n=2 Tax=Cochliobolus heterostrophus TaxID=5016 RepID=M2UBP3_COCH5|nr:uncharacterized protein COCC4DRAFT_135974 [Bipolaris maydis ATCC 48331]EMD91131.1 hypothetical protein COCHEDRAFT_1030865 [Bipolaris maydis C5]ENI05788.1 hypothetical protein COCC4DRAFT_135974 [Bipolaris maydis ATCC 48331]KAH7560231.1 hypothetical protein BM1_03865 [Bipolaris maydis]